MSLQKIITDVFVSGIARAAVRLRGLVFIPLITISLGVDAFGAYAQILAIVTLLELLFGLGLHDSLVRYGKRIEETADLYYSLVLVSGTSAALITGVMILFAPQLASLTLGSPEYAEALRAGALLVLIRTVFRLAWNYFRIDSRIKLFSLIEWVKAYGIVVAVVISVLVLKTGLFGLFVSMVLWEALAFAILQMQIIREIGVTVPTFRDIRMHIKFSIPIALSSLAENFSSRADRIMIGGFLGASAVGVYSIAYQIATAISMYVTPIQQTFFPEFSKFIDKEEFNRCKTYLHVGVRYFLIIALPTVAGMYLIGPDLISVLTNGQGIPSPSVIAIIALGITIQGVDRLYGVVIKAVEETDWRAKVIGLGAALNVVINAAMIPMVGIIGAALATVLTYFFVMVLTVTRVRGLLDMTPPWLTVFRCTGATLLMFVTAHLALDLRPILSVVISPPVYFGLLFLSKELTVEELRARFSPS